MSEQFLKTVSFIAFDYCGTLADLQPSSIKILGNWLQLHLGLYYPPEKLSWALNCVSTALPYSSLKVKDAEDRRRYFVEFNTRVLALLDCKEDQGESLYDYFLLQNRHWVLDPVVPELFSILRNRRYKLVLASNFDSTLTQLLSSNGNENLFDAIFVSAEMGIEKPDAAFYLHIQKSLGCTANQIAMVGDDLRLDIEPSLALGFKPIYYTPNSTTGHGSDQTDALGFIEIAHLQDLIQLCPGTGLGAP